MSSVGTKNEAGDADNMSRNLLRKSFRSETQNNKLEHTHGSV